MTPNYIKINIKNKSFSAQKARKQAVTTWLRSEIRSFHNKRNVIKSYLKLLHTSLAERLHPIEWELLDDKVRLEASFQSYKKRLTHRKKLDNLKKNQLNSCNLTQEEIGTHNFYPSFKNLSTARFTFEEEKLLQKGLKYNPKSTVDTNDLQHLSVDLHIGATKEDDLFKHRTAAEISKVKTRKQYTNPELNTLRRIKKKINEENLTIVKADKGNTLVVLPKPDYFAKVNNFLDPSEFIILNKDPTPSFNLNIKNFLKSCHLTSSEKDLFHLVNKNPHPPKLYGLPKLHKPSIPIRPVVAYSSAPSYKLAHKYNTIFKQYSNFNPSFSINNSLDLVNKIKHVDLPPNSKFISFDVTSLFTNVPVEKTLKIASDILFENRTHPTIHHEIMQALTLCTSQNYFQFDHKLYSQKNGLAMGSPLSPLLADIFMDHLEKRIFNSYNSLLKNILYWHRYVDDILCCWTGTDRQLNIFLNYLNKLEPSIKFTLEIESNNSLNFLDLTISKLSNKHCFQIYRKPTHTDCTINFHSSHPWPHKLAAFNSMIHRLITIPLSQENFLSELKIIKQIAVNNDFPISLIDRILHRKQNIVLIHTYLYSPRSPPESHQWLKLPYLPNISDKLISIIPKKYTISYYTTFSIFKFLSNSKDKVPHEEKSGVYKISCSDCPTCYIGKTSRNFKTRIIKEHFKFWQNSTPDKSNFSDHLISHNHSFDPQHNIQYLHFENNYRKLKFLEILQINTHLNNPSTPLCNDQVVFAANSPLLKIF